MASRLPLLALFVLSGFSGLVFEIVWVRLASLALGVTVYAVSVVVSAFMAGLALGGLLAGRVADQRGFGLRTYATLELCICGCGLLATWLLSHLEQVSAANLFGGHLIFEALLAGLVLLLPCTLMGATVPVLSRAVFLEEAPSRIIGWLYGANIVGAVVGALMADFVLIPGLGVFQAAAAAATVNALAGSIGWLLNRGPANGPSPSNEAEGKTGPLAARVYFVYGVVGFCALALQLVWVRILVVLVYTSVYAFSVLLATYLASMSLGTSVASALSARTRDAGMWALFGICAMAVSTLLSIFWYGPPN